MKILLCLLIFYATRATLHIDVTRFSAEHSVWESARGQLTQKFHFHAFHHCARTGPFVSPQFLVCCPLVAAAAASSSRPRALSAGAVAAVSKLLPPHRTLHPVTLAVYRLIKFSSAGLVLRRSTVSINSGRFTSPVQKGHKYIFQKQKSKKHLNLRPKWQKNYIN